MPYVKVVVDVLILQELLDLKVTVTDNSVHHHTVCLQKV